MSRFQFVRGTVNIARDTEVSIRLCTDPDYKTFNYPCGLICAGSSSESFQKPAYGPRLATCFQSISAKDSCQGDSGGPLMHNAPSGYEWVGECSKRVSNDFLSVLLMFSIQASSASGLDVQKKIFLELTLGHRVS